MFSFLPMYDWPELKSDNDKLWGFVRDWLVNKGYQAPEALSRKISTREAWLSSDLLLGQTCGFPYANGLKGRVKYVATPRYDVEGCSGPNYSSAMIVRIGSGVKLSRMENSIFAYNSTDSWSGYQVVVREFDFHDVFFDKSVVSGGHRNSARMVANGEADVAAIDAVCWHYIQEFDSEIASQLEVVMWTGPYPALPFITSIETPQEVLIEMRNCLCALGKNMYKPDASELMLNGCEVLGPNAYDGFTVT